MKKAGWVDDVQPVASGVGAVEGRAQPAAGVSMGREGSGGEGTVGVERGGV